MNEWEAAIAAVRPPLVPGLQIALCPLAATMQSPPLLNRTWLGSEVSATVMALGRLGSPLAARCTPWSSMVVPASETVETASWYHTQVGQWGVIGFVVLHLAAILFYTLRRHNLVKPMIVGDKHLPHPVLPSRDDTVSRIAAALLFGACVAVVTWMVNLASP